MVRLTARASDFSLLQRAHVRSGPIEFSIEGVPGPISPAVKRPGSEDNHLRMNKRINNLSSSFLNNTTTDSPFARNKCLE
jgi:hypothetical protein